MVSGKTGSEGPASPPRRIPVLDGLRAISILLVLGAHMLPLGPKVLQLNHAAGTMGMSLFFALSGFLIASALFHNTDIYEFMVKRLTRILPLAWGYITLTLLVLSFEPMSALLSATFLLNYFPAYMNSYNAHFWSLCVEIHFYFSIAAVVWMFGARSVWLVWVALLTVTALRISEGAFTHIQTHLRVDEILAGACVATLYRLSWQDSLRFPTLIAGAAAAFWFACSTPYGGPLQYLRPYATGFLMAAVLCHGDTLIARLLSSKPMRYIATVSYALYVFHPLSIHGWFNQGTVVERYLFKRPISFAFTFLMAHFSTFYWEKLWLQAGRRWIEQRRNGRPHSVSLAKQPD